MPTQTFANKWADTPFFRNFPRYAGIAVASFGLLDIASWYMHWRFILQMVPATAPMQYNTALSFALLGAGLVLLTTRWVLFARWLGAVAALIPILTMVEYVTGWDFGIDQIFLKPFFEAVTAYPGRMSPLSSVCFVLASTALVLVGGRKRRGTQLAVAGMTGCMIMVVGFVALIGFVFSIKSAYTWGSYSAMAVNTASVFLVLGCGLVRWSWQIARGENSNFLRWLPATGSVTLMAMITFVSAINIADTRLATFWRMHTLEVIQSAQEFEETVVNLRRNAFAYVSTGDAEALASFKAVLQAEPPQFDRLVELTSDNPVQQSRLRAMASAVERAIGYDRRLIAAYGRGDRAVVVQMRTNAEGPTVFGSALDVVIAFTQEEQRLLTLRDGAERDGAQNGAHLLVFSSVMAAVLLVAANYMIASEMRQRRKVELGRETLIVELQRALEEVDSLSGMIPICGWCKHIRSDEGYWQSVEQFVRSHTEATLTHGICPTCAEKFKADAEKLIAAHAS
ncbi:MAG TPA: CHASE3 domain-containing protein [Opitutaceae bacterium]